MANDKDKIPSNKQNDKLPDLHDRIQQEELRKGFDYGDRGAVKNREDYIPKPKITQQIPPPEEDK